MIAEFISLGVFRLLLAERLVSRCLAVSDPLGLGPVTCRVLLDSDLFGCWRLAASDASFVRRLARELSQLFISLRFRHLMKGVDTCLNLNACGFLFVSQYKYLLIFTVLLIRFLLRFFPSFYSCSSSSFLYACFSPDRGSLVTEMGLLDFVKSADRFKVKVEERTLGENEVLLVTETEDRVILPSLQTISLVDHTIRDELNVNSGKKKKKVAFASGSPPAKKAWTEGIVNFDSRPSTAGKSPSALQRLSRQNEQASTGSGSAAPATEDVSSSSVTPTPEFAHEDASHDNVRTRPASGRFVVLSSGSTDADIPTSPQVVPPVTLASTGINAPVAAQDSSADDFYESQTIDSVAAQNVYVPNWNVINNDRLASLVTCQNLLDHVTHPAYWAAFRNQHDATFLDAVNVNSAQHVCRVSELQIVDLNTRLEKSEAEAAEVIELRKRVSDLEETVAVKVGKMREDFALQQDATERQFAERVSELDARIADVRRDMDNDLYPHMLIAIAGRRWVIGHGLRLAVYKCARSVECHSAMGKVISMAINKGIQQGLEAGVIHGKAGRSLAQLEAYDPEVQGKYVVAVSEFENISFTLLDELESLKDSPFASIMFALVLKDDQGNVDAAPEFARFQPSLDQVDVPVYSDSGSVDHEMLLSEAIPSVCRSAERRGLCSPPSARTSGSVPPPGSSLDVVDYQVLSDDGGSAAQPPIV
ncbi:hypothetical protein Tco_0736136 [Tanacetum coccineum]